MRAIAKDPRHTCIILTQNFGCLHVHDFTIKYSAVYDSYVYSSDIKDVTNNDKATYGWHVIMSYIYKYIVCTKAISNYMLLTHQIPIKL